MIINIFEVLQDLLSFATGLSLLPKFTIGILFLFPSVLQLNSDLVSMYFTLVTNPLIFDLGSWGIYFTKMVSVVVKVIHVSVDLVWLEYLAEYGIVNDELMNI